MPQRLLDQGPVNLVYGVLERRSASEVILSILALQPSLQLCLHLCLLTDLSPYSLLQDLSQMYLRHPILNLGARGQHLLVNVHGEIFLQLFYPEIKKEIIAGV